MSSKWRRCDVTTSHRRQYVIMCLLGIWPPLPPPPNILNLPPLPNSLNLPTPMLWTTGPSFILSCVVLNRHRIGSKSATHCPLAKGKRKNTLPLRDKGYLLLKVFSRQGSIFLEKFTWRFISKVSNKINNVKTKLVEFYTCKQLKLLAKQRRSYRA